MFLKNSIKAALALPDGESTQLTVAIAGAPLELLTRKEAPYLIVNIADRETVIGMKVWDRVEESLKSFKSESIWDIQVVKSTYEGEPQLTFSPGKTMPIAENAAGLYQYSDDVREALEHHLARIYPTSGKMVFGILHEINLCCRNDIDTVFKHVFGIREEIDLEKIATIKAEDKTLSSAVEAIIDANIFKTQDDVNNFRAFFDCPAAKGFHGAYLHGLIGHVDTMLHAISAIEKVYERSPSTEVTGKALGEVIDFDAIRLTCICHDFFKIKEYVWNGLGSISMADGERTFYHDFLMAFKLQAITDKTPEVEALIDLMTHAVLMHHGEYGNYKPDKRLRTYVESEIFHFIDIMDSRIVGAIEGK